MHRSFLESICILYDRRTVTHEIHIVISLLDCWVLRLAPDLVPCLCAFRKRSLEGMKRKRQQDGAASDDSEVEDPGMQEDQAEAEESEDEAEYYRQAVGQEPDEGIVKHVG